MEAHVNNSDNLAAALQEFEDYLYLNELTEQTINKYMIDLKQFSAMLNQYGVNNLNSLNPKILYKCRDELMKKYKIATVAGKIITINKFLNYVGYENKLKVPKIQNKSSVDDVMSIKQYKALLRWSKKEDPSEKFYYIFKTLASTGMRISELQYLTLKAVNEGMIREINSKGKIRDIPISQKICKSLKEYCICNNIVNEDEPIFITKFGNPMRANYIWRMMQKIGGKAKIPKKKLHPHTLRHLFGKMYMEKYKNLSELADILGHSSLNTTRIYTKTSINEKRSKMSDLGL